MVAKGLCRRKVGSGAGSGAFGERWLRGFRGRCRRAAAVWPGRAADRRRRSRGLGDRFPGQLAGGMPFCGWGHWNIGGAVEAKPLVVVSSFHRLELGIRLWVRSVLCCSASAGLSIGWWYQLEFDSGRMPRACEYTDDVAE
ncbi:hypothetical protein K456DRAFT_1326550 [Colletotrichum gloeosporioides 23]|nr:hypothetical protein K456DRAFT_1326550 [Colletotrichum gloeosporioides 23]